MCAGFLLNIRFVHSFQLRFDELRKSMLCRPGCGACCIAISISSPIPGMPEGKPAGIRCLNLDDDFRCRLYGTPERPSVCIKFKAEPLICGNSREQAMDILTELEG